MKKTWLMICLVSSVFLAPEFTHAQNASKEQFVLATARARGAGGEEFVSSLRIFNPSQSTANVTIAYLAQSAFDGSFTASGRNDHATTASVSVDPGQTYAVEDVLDTMFGSMAPFGIAAGGLRILSNVPVIVLSRTVVANAQSATGVSGTSGFCIPAASPDFAIGDLDVGILPFVSASPVSESGFRSNLIMLNTGTDKAVVHVKLLRGDGSLVGERDYTLFAYSAAQQANIAASFGYGASDTNLLLAVTVAKQSSPVLVGVSLIDNAISSISYLPATKTPIVQ